MFLFPPSTQAAECGFGLHDMLLRLRVERGHRPDGNECGTGVIFAQAVFEAVLAITSWARHTNGVQGVYIRSAGRVRALRVRPQRRFPPIAWRVITRRGEVGRFPPRRGPFAGVRAFMRRFGAVVQTVGTAAGLAAKGQKVVLVAVSILATGADGFNVIVHGGVAEGFGRRRAGRGCHDVYDIRAPFL